MSGETSALTWAAAQVAGVHDDPLGQFALTHRQSMLRTRAHVLGLLAAALGEHQRADEHLQCACEFHEANGMPLWPAVGSSAGQKHSLRKMNQPRRASTATAHAAALVGTESTAGT